MIEIVAYLSVAHLFQTDLEFLRRFDDTAMGFHKAREILLDPFHDSVSTRYVLRFVVAFPALLSARRTGITHSFSGGDRGRCAFRQVPV